MRKDVIPLILEHDRFPDGVVLLKCRCGRLPGYGQVVQYLYDRLGLTVINYDVLERNEQLGVLVVFPMPLY